MSLVADKTGLLFSRFMPIIVKTRNAFTSDVFDVRIFPENYSGAPSETFIKFAAVEVLDVQLLPDIFEKLPEIKGQYAVFNHKGTAGDSFNTFNFIFSQWFPNSDFIVDSRPHFDILPSGYNPTDQNAVHEIWIPITSRTKPHATPAAFTSNSTT